MIKRVVDHRNIVNNVDPKSNLEVERDQKKTCGNTLIQTNPPNKTCGNTKP